MSLPSIAPFEAMTLRVERLTPDAFAAFGAVITSPVSSDLTTYPPKIPSPQYAGYQPEAVPANQATALKTSPVSPLVNNYPTSKTPSGPRKVGVGLMSIFSSFPRQNTYISTDQSTGKQKIKLKLGILERHPYTTQTFCPFSYSQPKPSSSSTTHNSYPALSEKDKTFMLVIVAPTCRLPSMNPPNPPDLANVRAFIAPLNDPDTPTMAVTYAPGTWHAPMIVLGSRRVDFLVTQFANGVPNDDCQEVLIGSGPDHSKLSDEENQLRLRKGLPGKNIEVDTFVTAEVIKVMTTWLRNEDKPDTWWFQTVYGIDAVAVLPGSANKLREMCEPVSS